MHVRGPRVPSGASPGGGGLARTRSLESQCDHFATPSLRFLPAAELEIQPLGGGVRTQEDIGLAVAEPPFGIVATDPAPRTIGGGYFSAAPGETHQPRFGVLQKGVPEKVHRVGVLRENHHLAAARPAQLVQDTLQAVKLAVRGQSADPSQEAFDVGLLFGGKRLAFPCADVIGLQDVVRGVVVRCVFGKARQWPRPPGGHCVEMALQRLAEGTETTGKPAAVDGHDESHGVVAQIKCEVERDPDETGGMKSRGHPKYKTKYRVRNWVSYERALICRGNITIWLSRAAIAAWKPEGTRTRGAPPKYSDLAIETALTLRLLFHLPLRQAEGFLTSLFHLMGLNLRSPDHTTLSRRGQHLNLTLRRVPRRIALHLFIDSTGLSMVGEGEWAAAKHGRRGRRGWKTRHLGVDHAGVIVAQALTDSAVDDASTGIGLIETIASSARMITADAAYDTLAFYETANTRGTTVVVPPAKTAKLSRRNPRSSARDGTIRKISKIGRRRWKKEVGYHRQARVENAFFRYTSMLGDRLRSRTRAAQAVESVRACNVLNRMTELGRPESFAIDR